MTVPLKTRVLLADDHEVVRDGLRMVLDAVADIEVVAEVGDGAEAVDRAIAERVDLAILDVSMPRMTGLQAAAALTRREPGIRVLILSMHDNEQYFFEALKAGASGYVLKTAANRDLVEACRAAMRGEPFLYPPAVTAVVRDYLERARESDEAPSDPLTPREQEITKLIAEGHPNAEIARMLVISPSTVERHRSNILEKLGMRNRVELTRYAAAASSSPDGGFDVWPPERRRAIVPAMSIFSRKRQTDQRMAPCPKCLQKVPADAIDCPVCGADLRERPPKLSAQPR